MNPVAHRRRDAQLRLPVEVLVVEVVELATGHDLARHRRPRHGVAEHRDLDLAAGDRLLDDDMIVVPQRLVDRRAQRVAVADLGDTDGRSEIRRLDEHRKAELVDDPAQERRVELLLPRAQPPRLRQAVLGEHVLRRRLVEAQRRGEDAGTDVRNPGELEQALHGAVLTHRTVQQRQHDHGLGGSGRKDRGKRIELRAIAVIGRRQRARADPEGGDGVCRLDPPPVAGDPDRHDVVLRRVSRVQHVERGDAGDFVLGGLSSEEDHEAHTVVPGTGRHECNCKTRGMRFQAAEIERATGGKLIGEDVVVDGATIDSREVAGRELFVPVVAERDGHDFIDRAVEKGAAAYLTSREPVELAAAAILVADTAMALIDLGRHARTRLADLTGGVIGITGSVGKTTVKDLTAAALTPHFRLVHASPRSFNNELGVPLTLANSPDGVDAVVVEMGARGRGHIAALCEIARPTVGIVTAVALAHAEMFGTIEDVAVAKGELVEALPASGTAVLNGDDPLVDAMANRTAARVVTFGVDRSGVDVTASEITIDDELRPSFRLHSPWGGADVQLTIRGAHQVMNALAAATGAMASGADPDSVAEGLHRATSSPWRMDLQPTSTGALILNDAYNANPTSMEAALRSLAALPARRRIAVLGVMAELGPGGRSEHRRIAELAHDLGIEVIAVDAPDYDTAAAIPVDGVAGAVEALGTLGDGDAVLVKGSRVAALEKLAVRLLS